MGYFVGINERRYFVDDNGLVYTNEQKTLKAADDINDLMEPKKEVKEIEQKVDDGVPKAKFVCDRCGYFVNYKMAFVQHMKKHKVKIE